MFFSGIEQVCRNVSKIAQYFFQAIDGSCRLQQLHEGEYNSSENEFQMNVHYPIVSLDVEESFFSFFFKLILHIFQLRIGLP